MEQSTLFRGELRAESQGEKYQLVGYAALFNSPSKNLGGFTEVIAPGAFDRALREKQVVRFTFNHSLDAVLARSDNGSLALATDSKGLKFKAQLNQNIQQHRDLFEACKAGLYDEMSFAFVASAGGQQWSPDGSQRMLTDVDLLDVSLVAVPAYNDTSAAARSAAAIVGRSELLTRVLAMPGDWARQERANAIEREIAADEKRAAADDEEDETDPEMDDLRSALADHFGKASHGHTPKYWPVEMKDKSVIASDMDSYDAKYVSIPCTRDEEGNFTFGDPSEDGIDYTPTGRAANYAAEVRTAKADSTIKVRMRAAAGI